jgi:hypothetical protein
MTRIAFASAHVVAGGSGVSKSAIRCDGVVLEEQSMSSQLTGLTPLIEVYDMPEAIRFYCDILGFEIVASSPEIEAPEGKHFQWAQLRLGPLH